MTYLFPYEYSETTDLDEFGQLWYYPPISATRFRYYFSGDNPNKPADIQPQIFYDDSVVLDYSFNDLECFLYGFRWMYTVGEQWYWGYAIPSSDKRYISQQTLPNNRSLSCVFQCPFGYYITNVQNIWGVTLCGICHDSCYACYGPGIDNCKSCKYKTDSLKTNLIRSPIGNGTCNANNCATNEYLANSICVSCEPHCNTCNQFICLKCADGYYLDGLVCTTCPLNCKTCDFQECLVCLQPFVNHTLSYSLASQTIPSSLSGGSLAAFSEIDYSCLPKQMSLFTGTSTTESLKTTHSNTFTLTSTNYITSTVVNTNSVSFSTSFDFSDFSTFTFATSTTFTNSCIYTTSTITNSHLTTTFISTIQNHNPVMVIVNNTFQNNSNYYYNTFIQPIYFNYKCTRSQPFVSIDIESTAVISADNWSTLEINTSDFLTKVSTLLGKTSSIDSYTTRSVFNRLLATSTTAQGATLSNTVIQSSILEMTSTISKEGPAASSDTKTVAVTGTQQIYQQGQSSSTFPIYIQISDIAIGGQSTTSSAVNLLSGTIALPASSFSTSSAAQIINISFSQSQNKLPPPGSSAEYDSSVNTLESTDTSTQAPLSTTTITSFVTSSATISSNISSQASISALPTSIIIILSVMSVFLFAIILVLMIWSRKSVKKYKMLKHSPTVPLNCVIRSFEEFKIATHLIKPIEKVSHCGIFEMTFGKLILPNDKNIQVLIKSIDKSDEYIFSQEVELNCKLRGVTKIHQFIGYCETPTKNLIIYAHYEMTLSDWFLSPATNLLQLTDYQYQVKLIIPQIINGLTALHAMKQNHGNVGLQAVYIQNVSNMSIVVGELRIKPNLSQNEVDQPIYARYLNSKILKQFSKGFLYKYGEMDDIFAFGILLYEIVHGEKAYCNLDLAGTLQKIENEEFPMYTLQLYADMYQKCMENTVAFKDLNK